MVSPKFVGSPSKIRVENLRKTPKLAMRDDPSIMLSTKRSLNNKTTKYGYRVPYPDEKPKTLRNPSNYVNKT
jgi:hypothetical protein